MTEEEAEAAPMSTEKEPASAPVKDASVSETTGSRKRKQVQFFAPDDVKKTEKLVIKEVSILRTPKVELPVTHQPASGRTLSASPVHIAQFDVAFPGITYTLNKCCLSRLLLPSIRSTGPHLHLADC